jgi:hypothetical protein
MATIGDVLEKPEIGWKRIDDTNEKLIYGGDWNNNNPSDANAAYNGTLHSTTKKDANISFKFYGKKLRIIGVKNYADATSIKVNIDGTVYTYSDYAASISHQVLVFEKTELVAAIHTVVITNTEDGKYLTFDAVDIDEDGEVLPYAITSDDKILRVTLIDSSDHEYQLAGTEIDAFVEWYNNHVSTDTNAYGLAKKIGNQSSTEYVAFEKIISFEVI